MNSEEATEAKTAGPPPAITPRGTVPRPPSKQAHAGPKPKAKAKPKAQNQAQSEVGPPTKEAEPPFEVPTEVEARTEAPTPTEPEKAEQVAVPAKSGSDKLRAWGDKGKANAEKTPAFPANAPGAAHDADSDKQVAPASQSKVAQAPASIAPAAARNDGPRVQETPSARIPASGGPADTAGSVSGFEPVAAETNANSGSPSPAKSAGTARKVKLSIARIDPWSVMKLSFLLSIAIGIMIVVATWVFWYTLNNLGVFTSIDEMITDIAGPGAEVNILDYVARDRVLSLGTLIAVVDVVLLTALSTIGAFLYNIVAALVGGIHLTMTDD